MKQILWAGIIGCLHASTIKELLEAKMAQYSDVCQQ